MIKMKAKDLGLSTSCRLHLVVGQMLFLTTIST